MIKEAVANQLQNHTKQLFTHLHRGGRYAHLWTDAGHTSYWFRVDRPSRRHVPRRWLHNNVYFSVHPLSQIPPQNSSGSRDRRYISSQTDYICAINTLFAEFDSKDTVLPLEYAAYLPIEFRLLNAVEKHNAVKAAKEKLFYRYPQYFKARTLYQIRALAYPPSVIIDSGGGFHCYWLLRETVPLDAINRADVQVVQHGWVHLMGGDPGAADLRRVLRMPGTTNCKAAFGDRSPRVRFVKVDFDLLYDYTALEETVNDWLYARRVQNQQRRQARAQREQADRQPSVEPDLYDLRARFNQEHSLVDLLCAHGYQISYQQDTQTRLARPGRERSQSSVTVFAAHGDVPELSVHFSTNDPLYTAETVNEQTGQLRRRVNDAFAAYTRLEHQGDWAAVYAKVAGARQSQTN